MKALEFLTLLYNLKDINPTVFPDTLNTAVFEKRELREYFVVDPLRLSSWPSVVPS